jgi:hypothetical protein
LKGEAKFAADEGGENAALGLMTSVVAANAVILGLVPRICRREND